MVEQPVHEFLDLILPLCRMGSWLSMDELVDLTKLRPPTIRWCVRHLPTGEEGAYIIHRRKRPPRYKNITEFFIDRKTVQQRFEWT